METKKIFCDVTKCVGCKTCELVCAVEHALTKDLFLAVLEEPKPIKRIDSQFIPHLNYIHDNKDEFGKGAGFIEKDIFHSIGCQHCDDPPCIEACMTGCISKDNQTGKVDIDIERCVGCWMCIMVCPFAAISRQYTKENKALKCDLCPDRDNPACVDYCPTRALSFKTRKEPIKSNI